MVVADCLAGIGKVTHWICDGQNRDGPGLRRGDDRGGGNDCWWVTRAGHGELLGPWALGEAAGPRAVQAIRGVAVARLAVGLALALVAVQVAVLRGLGAALHSHGDEGLGGGARRDGRRGHLLTGGYAGRDCRKDRERDALLVSQHSPVSFVLQKRLT